LFWFIIYIFLYNHILVFAAPKGKNSGIIFSPASASAWEREMKIEIKIRSVW